MRDALFAAGRPIVFSICEWGSAKPWEWAKEVGHLWRTTQDIVDRWDAMMALVDKQRDLAKYALGNKQEAIDDLSIAGAHGISEAYEWVRKIQSK